MVLALALAEHLVALVTSGVIAVVLPPNRRHQSLRLRARWWREIASTGAVVGGRRREVGRLLILAWRHEVVPPDLMEWLRHIMTICDTNN